MRRWRISVVIGLIAVLTPLGVWGGRSYEEGQRRSRLRNDAISCANHAIQLKLLVYRFVQAGGTFPAGGDARATFQQMAAATGYGSEFAGEHFFCPESYRRDGSLGYVFVADGLSTKEVAKHDALVFFCPAANHRGAFDAHAMLGAINLRCLANDAERVAVLERALAQAASGEVRYSPGAVARIKADLDSRK